MEIWFIILISISISALVKSFLNLIYPTKKPTHNLPPGPVSFPIIGNVLWLGKSITDLEPILRSLHAKLGPMITLHIGSRPSIFISDRFLAHQALVQSGAVFADRPPPPATNVFTISGSNYGPTWRILRRNLTAEILHPSRVKSYSHARKWVLQILLDCLQSKSKSGETIRVVEDFQYAMFCLLVLMCFGDKLDQNQIKEIEAVQLRLRSSAGRYNMLHFWPRVTKVVLHKRWQEIYQHHQDKENLYVPLIRSRKKLKEEKFSKAKEDNDEFLISYVDTLLDLQLPEEKRKLNEGEIVGLCSEFLVAGGDTTSAALQWIMASLVKNPHIQEKLFMEMKRVVGDGEEEVKEDDLQKMSYLKAVVLEGLRRHPPAHFLSHKVKEDVVFDGYLFPKNGTVNFTVAEMGWDPKVWADPMEFKPERFLNNNNNSGGELFDLTVSREIKMMPFGAGRRICPGYGLAILELEYFVANLIWKFKWNAVDGDDVSLEEKLEFTVVMKYPLQAQISPRF